MTTSIDINNMRIEELDSLVVNSISNDKPKTTLQELLNAGLSPNYRFSLIPNLYESAPTKSILQYAVNHATPDVLSVLLSAPDLDLYPTSSTPHEAGCFMYRYAPLENIKLFIKHKDFCINKSHSGCTLIAYYTRGDKLDFLQALLETHPNLKKYEEDQINTLIYFILRQGFSFLDDVKKDEPNFLSVDNHHDAIILTRYLKKNSAKFIKSLHVYK